MSKKQKLELTWIGKDEQAVLEPRILIEDPEKSYGDPHSENMLIHGDNLLALKALEQKFAGKVKCIFIDPPYMGTEDVAKKTEAALNYCANATTFTTSNGGKPWKYLLIPHDAVMHNMSFDGLAIKYEINP